MMIEEIKKSLTSSERTCRLCRVLFSAHYDASRSPIRRKSSSGVLELIEDYTGRYLSCVIRSVRNQVLMCHVFQKKAKHGIATPKQEMDFDPETG